MDDAIREFTRLVEIMDTLRGPDGCPWDREQTFETLKTFVIEECYELVETVDTGDTAALCGELGDLQLQIVFMARIAREQGLFTIADVLKTINEKMIRRHPHVFGDGQADTPRAVLEQWEEIKAEERNNNGDTDRKGLLSTIPRGLPALQTAYQIGIKTERVGFDWDQAAGVEEKVMEEWREFKQAEAGNDRDHMREEFGDLLFTLAQLARKHGIDPEDALRQSNRKVMRRFARMEEQTDVHAADRDELEALWAAVKREET